jgi:hypothetical protein
MTYLESAHKTVKKTTAADSHEELRSSHELRGHPSPDGMSLSIQYVRQGLDSSPEVLLAEILQSWRHHTTPSSHGIDKLRTASQVSSRWFDPEHNVESRWTRIMETAAMSHSSTATTSTASCELPRSTVFEHDDTVSRLNDLSEWQFASSSYLETTQHSTFCFMHLVEAIASHPSVLSMTVQGRPVLLNYDARGMIQSGNPVLTPFSDLGLYGEGQVVGVCDSGLDDYSCYFYDNSGAYSSVATTRSSYTQPKVEQSRRKVVQYVAYADGSDPAAGHGTHVVGTIVGDSIFDGYAKANGIAPAAKVAFYDVMNSNSPYLSIPDTYSYVYTTLYNAGARVMSNSWGSYATESLFSLSLYPSLMYCLHSPVAQYTERQYDADNFMYQKQVNAPLPPSSSSSLQDSLIIFAAGNSGGDGYRSAYSPCTRSPLPFLSSCFDPSLFHSKNVLCVGSVDLRDDATDDPIAWNDNRVSDVNPTLCHDLPLIFLTSRCPNADLLL